MKIKTVKTKSSRQCLYQCWAHSNSLCFVNFRKRNWFMKISSENCTKVSPEVRSWLIKSGAAQRTSQRCKENQRCPCQWENESCQKSQWTFLWDLLSFDKISWHWRRMLEYCVRIRAWSPMSSQDYLLDSNKIYEGCFVWRNPRAPVQYFFQWNGVHGLKICKESLADLKNRWLIFDEAAEKYCFGSRITVQMDKWFHQDTTVVNCSRCWLKVFRGTLCHCRAMAVHLKFCDITLSVDCEKCKSGL